MFNLLLSRHSNTQFLKWHIQLKLHESKQQRKIKRIRIQTGMFTKFSMVDFFFLSQ